MTDAARHVYSLVTGVALVYFPFGNGIVLAALPSLLTYLAMWRIREYASTLAWLVDFTFLIGWYDNVQPQTTLLLILYLSVREDTVWP